MLYGLWDVWSAFLRLKDKRMIVRSEEFLALDHVSFKANQGECIGLLGPNGAGKTTLLRLLLGVLLIDSGTIDVKGDISAILTTRAGLHQDLSGRENIFYCGALQKKSKKEIESVSQNIIDMAELGEFLDAPVKTYSSGMRARLVFAIFMQFVPTILLLDEVLFAGDMKFQERCRDTILELKKKNVTVIFASHNADLVMSVSERIIILDKGRIQFDGQKEEALEFYHRMVQEKGTAAITVGEEAITISQVEVMEEGGKPTYCTYGRPAMLSFVINAKETIENYKIIVAIVAKESIPIIKTEKEFKSEPLRADSEVRMTIFLGKVALVTGAYSISIKLYDLRAGKLLKAIKNATIFTVKEGPLGVCPLYYDFEWQFENL